MPALLDGLNASQREVVAHSGGPLLVVGGPGTGKTRALTERYAWLVEEGVPAECVLALTFSDPAAAAMRANLEGLLDRPYEELNVLTFHSFCVKLLQDEALEAGVGTFFSPAPPADRLALLLDRIDELSLPHHEIRGNPAPLLGSFVSRIDRLKEEMVTAEEGRAWAERLPMDTDAARAHNCREREFARLYRDHDRLLDERGALDFGDLVLRSYRLLHECPHVRERTAHRFRHLLVDEYQQATRAQRMLLHLLADEHEGLTVVADDEGVAGEVERLVADGVPPEEICVLVRSVKTDAAVVAAALEERAVPFRTCGAAAYFQRAEVRDVLAWLRALADPNDSGAVGGAPGRPPIELRSVDVARLTQLARRRKLDMPSAVAAALEGPQLSEEGRDRARAFLRLYRSACAAFEERRPDAFVMRLIERIGVRRQQFFATHADTAERLRNIAKLPELATAYMRREPQATARDFARYLAAVAESGLREDEAVGQPSASAVPVMAMQAARGLEFDHVFVLGLSATAMPGPHRPHAGDVPDELRRSPRPDHEAEMRRLLHLAITRARRSLVLTWPENAVAAVRAEPAPSRTADQRPSPFYEEARAAVGVEEELFEEELFGPAEGLHSTFRLMRDELLDTVARVGGRLGEMRLDTYLDVDQAMARYLELIKVAALIERTREGQRLDTALPEVNEILAQCATAEQREIFEESGLDGWLRDAGREPGAKPAGSGNGSDASLDPFIPRRGRGLMLSASDLDTYRICPLKYKFARVFRIPQEPTIHQRFGIALHQVLERFHTGGGGSLGELMELFEASWRRAGFGHSDDERQFRERAVAALERYWREDHESDAEPVWFERSFAFRLGPHLLRGRVDRVDRRPDGSYELIDYKTGKAKTESELREDVQLSLYQMGARESWRLKTSAQSYFYVLTGDKVPVEHSEEELDRVKSTVTEIADGILRQDFEPTPSYEICSFCDYRIISPAVWMLMPATVAVTAYLRTAPRRSGIWTCRCTCSMRARCGRAETRSDG